MNLSIAISVFSALLSLAALFITYNVSVATQRSFVFIEQFQSFVLNDYLVVMPKWQNMGSTPTRKMSSYVSWKADPVGLPEDYSFPNLDSAGNPTVDAKSIATFIGPKGSIFGQEARIPLATLEAAQLGNTKIYIWGWAKYEDVFWLTKKHETKFCNEIAVTGITVDPNTKVVTAGIAFPQYKAHNCFDGDCK